MTSTNSIDQTVNKAGFRFAMATILLAVLSLFLPLDAPLGTFSERMLWYSSNVDGFVIGWVVQMLFMLTASGVFAATAWQIRKSHPLGAVVAGAAVLISVVAFMIPKFIAIWSIPQMVVESSTITANVVVAEQLFELLNPSLPFSLFQSFDSLGFWMYGVFGLLVARPLFRLSMSAKISAVAFGLFGLLFHILFIGVLTGSVGTTDINAYFESIGILLMVSIIGMAVYFRAAIKAKSEE